MAINLETPKKFKPLVDQAHQVATEVFRPISRKYDEAEHTYPKELDMLASLIDGMNEGAAIASGATDEQLEHYGGKWAAMAITEPEAGSDSSAIRTTAVLDGDEYVLNGEKIYVTAGERAELIVVWATLDRSI